MAPGGTAEAQGSSNGETPIVGEAAEPTAAPESFAGEKEPSTETSPSKPATAPPKPAPEDAPAVAEQPAPVAGKDDPIVTPSTPATATSAVANEGNQPPRAGSEAGNQAAEPTAVAGSPTTDKAESSSSTPATAASVPPESASEDPSAVATNKPAAAGKDDATATPSMPATATGAVAGGGSQPPDSSVEEADPALNEAAEPTAAAASPAAAQEPSLSTAEPTTASLPPAPALTESEETTHVAPDPPAAVVEQNQPAETEDYAVAPSHGGGPITAPSEPAATSAGAAAKDDPQSRSGDQTPSTSTTSNVKVKGTVPMIVPPSTTATPMAAVPASQVGATQDDSVPLSQSGGQGTTPTSTTSSPNVKVKGGARTPITPTVPMLVPAPPSTTTPVLVPATPTASDTSAADAMSTGRDCLVSGDLEKFSMGRRTKGMALGINFGSLFGMKNWKTRHFRLFSDGALSYFETAESATPLDVVMVRNGGTIVEKAGPSNHPNATGANDFCVVFNDGTEQVTLLLRAASTEDRLQWVTALCGITAPPCSQTL